MIREFGFDRKIDTSLSDFRGNIITGRVTNIYLTETDDENLGCIEIESVSKKTNTTQKAYPFFPNNTSYPLIDEIVLCFNLPSQYIGSQQANEKLYYINSINIWNNPHVNFYPDPEATNGNIPASENKNYNQIFNAAPVDLTTTNNNSSPGVQGTFRERDNIHPLQPYMGDVIQQGRFGNSIRFGSTNQRPDNNKGINNWSDYNGESKIFNTNVQAQTGDPILILRNGQPVLNEYLPSKPWTPIDEQINWDLSSIYMTSNQKIKIETTNNWVNSISSFSNNKEEDKPTKPSDFTGKPQVIINSDRLIFNARKDDTLISAGKSIHLSSNGNINFDTSKMVLESQDIKLGSYDAKQSVILGDKFLEQFDGVLEAMSKLCTQLQKTQIWPAGVPVTEPGIITSALALKKISDGVRDNIQTFKSQVVKTK